MLDQSDDDDDDGALDGDEGVVVEDEACFVDGWEGKVGEFAPQRGYYHAL